MLHIVPILCLIFFIWFIEIQQKREMQRISDEFRELKKRILNNKNEIMVNRDNIKQNREDITKLNNG